MNNLVAKTRARKNQNHPKNHPSTSKPIIRISPNGDIERYVSMNEAARAGFSRSRISECCNGHVEKYRGYR